MSVYWNISVLPKQVAQLTFLNERMGITCEKSRAFIYIKEQSAKAVETVCRDDNVLPRTLNLRQHFWINITNCKPSAKQQLSLQFLVTFQKNSGKLYSHCYITKFSMNFIQRNNYSAWMNLLNLVAQGTRPPHSPWFNFGYKNRSKMWHESIWCLLFCASFFLTWIFLQHNVNVKLQQSKCCWAWKFTNEEGIR